MSIRLAASGLALAAALTVATAARAQGFFEFYDLSPRQIAGMLSEEGYQLNGPMLRRGDVYVCNAVSISGRPMRLIVDAHRGRVLERFATSERRRFGDESYDRRASRDEDENWSDDDRSSRRHDQVALGDPRWNGDNSDDPSIQQPTPPDVVPEPAPKPKRHATKKHREPAVATAPASSATPSIEPTPAAVEPPKPTPSPSVAAVAPSAPVETPKPPVRVIKVAPAPETAKPAVEVVKPAQAPEPPKATPTVEAQKAAPAEKPKAESPKKKINDLPVGTLD